MTAPVPGLAKPRAYAGYPCVSCMLTSGSNAAQTPNAEGCFVACLFTSRPRSPHPISASVENPQIKHPLTQPRTLALWFDARQDFPENKAEPECVGHRG